MRKTALFIIVIMMATASLASAQYSGALVGSLGMGLTSAQGGFTDLNNLAAGSGFGMGAELKYYLLTGFGIGAFINYDRFGSSARASAGRPSYNFTQIGGVAKMNLFDVGSGRLFASGGGGFFTPSAHFYVPDNSTNKNGSSGQFAFGGLGLSSDPLAGTIYELEVRYNVGNADFKLNNKIYKVWDFLYVGAKISFSSKAKVESPRY
jgi:hypothetical protein